MDEQPRVINGDPVLAEARIVRSHGIRMRCDCGHDRWDVLREYNARTNRIIVILAWTIVLVPILFPFYFKNQGIYACSECGHIEETGASAAAAPPDAS